MAQRSFRTTQRGVTLIEACAVLTVIGVLAASGLPSLKPLLERKSLQGLAAEVAAGIHHARSEAVARQEGVYVDAQPAQGGSCFIVYAGPERACRCGDAAAPVCEAEGRAVNYRFLSAGSGLVASTTNREPLRFDPRLGTATPGGTLQMTSTSGTSVHHVVNMAGRLRSCSPNAAVPGFRACP